MYFLLLQLWLGLLINQFLLDGSFGVVYLLALWSAPAYQCQQEKKKTPPVTLILQKTSIMLSNQFSSITQSCPTLCDLMDCSMTGLPVSYQLPELAQTHVHWVVMPSNHLILCHPLLFLPSMLPSIQIFSNESVLHIRWARYWSFSFSISPFNEYSGLISFRIDWLDLLAVQGTLESSPTPQFKSINSLVLSFLYSPTLTSTHDYWTNYSLD